ncbi:MAG: molybdopterin biosynthesis protein [Methanomicrobiales archaeon]|nr:molybdopterin biosynthesis protein [Methanomicrobiales archaeon]
MVTRYLKLITLEEARTLIRTSFPHTISHTRVPIEEAVGRITAKPLFAKYSVPAVHLSAMDGIAVRSTDTHTAGEQHPVVLGDVKRVNTGNVVPAPYDAVIMIEDVTIDGDRFTIRKAAARWQHVRSAGEDIAESEMALPSMHRVRPHEVGALAAYGVTDIEVVSLRVGFIPTGSELVFHGAHPAPGQVVESNTVMAAAWLETLGVTCTRYPITPDDPERIRQMIERGAEENDLVIVSAGSSAGTRDFTAETIRELGVLLAHGVAMKPGKPVIIGKVEGTPVIGMPGYPLAALTVIREIVIPLLANYGITAPAKETLNARLTTSLHSEVGTDEFVLLSVGKIGGQYVATPQSRGAGVQMSAVRANAYLRIPRNLEGYEAGSEVPVTLMVTRVQADSALLITGSHDPSIDYLADMLQKRGVEVHSTHAGSMGGLMALLKGDCHAAPMHLLCESGEYNTCYLQKYLPGEDLVILTVAGREQGIVSKDGIGIDDLKGRQFINRQKGSGTRILLDYELKKRGIDPSSIPGYDREVTTHIAVGLAVKTGEADAGMCVYSAAKSLGLKFVPVGNERYEIVTRKEHLSDPRVAVLFETVSSPEFISTLDRLGGYDTSETGHRHQLP